MPVKNVGTLTVSKLPRLKSAVSHFRVRLALAETEPKNTPKNS